MQKEKWLSEEALEIAVNRREAKSKGEEKRYFSHSEGCLFTLLIVSFVVQKLLSLIRSHLFIFVFISITLGGGS